MCVETSKVDNCLVYNSANACMTCKEDYYLKSSTECVYIELSKCVAATSSTVCVSCSDGKYPDSNGECNSSCSVTNCDLCSTGGICSLCDDDYTLVSATNTCISSTIKNCAYVTAATDTKCASCRLGYYNNSAGGCAESTLYENVMKLVTSVFAFTTLLF